MDGIETDPVRVADGGQAVLKDESRRGAGGIDVRVQRGEVGANEYKVARPLLSCPIP